MNMIKQYYYYMCLSNTVDPKEFFGSDGHSGLCKICRSEFKPELSTEYLQETNGDLTKATSVKWWEWLEDFKPDGGLPQRRYLLDPAANVYDIEQRVYINPEQYSSSGSKHPIKYWHVKLPRPGKKDLSITRGRLIAYRYFFAWCDYLLERMYDYAPKVTTTQVVNNGRVLATRYTIDWEELIGWISGNNSKANGEVKLQPTGFYDPDLNAVIDRNPDGRVRKSKMGPSHNPSVWMSPLEVDHIDRNGLNDTPRNIRWADRAMNMANRNGTAGRAH